MNEPTEYAQKFTGKLTAGALARVVAQGHESLYLHGDAALDRASYSDAFVFTMTAVKARADRAKGTPEVSARVEVPGWVTGGHSDTVERTSTIDGRAYKAAGAPYHPTKGFWSLSHTGREAMLAILDLLPADAEVCLQVALDWGTNELLMNAVCDMQYQTERGLHSDRLYLHATWTRRGKVKRAQFLISAETSAHNSARFGRGG